MEHRRDLFTKIKDFKKIKDKERLTHHGLSLFFLRKHLRFFYPNSFTPNTFFQSVFYLKYIKMGVCKLSEYISILSMASQNA